MDKMNTETDTNTNTKFGELNEKLFFKVFKNIVLFRQIINNSFFIFDMNNTTTCGDAHFEDKDGEIVQHPNTNQKTKSAYDPYGTNTKNRRINPSLSRLFKNSANINSTDSNNNSNITTNVNNNNNNNNTENNNNNNTNKQDNNENKISRFVLTNDRGNQVGGVWSNIKIPMIDNILIKFQFQIMTDTDGNNVGGDGFAVVFNPTSNKEISERYHGGATIGYSGVRSGVVAIEFDTYRNEDEPNDNHISIQVPKTNFNNILSLSSAHNASIALASPTENMKDGKVHSVEIYFNKSDCTLSITMDSIELLKDINVPSLKSISESYIGFTSACGYYHSKHIIKNCEILKQ